MSSRGKRMWTLSIVLTRRACTTLTDRIDKEQCTRYVTIRVHWGFVRQSRKRIAEICELHTHTNNTKRVYSYLRYIQRRIQSDNEYWHPILQSKLTYNEKWHKW